MCRFVGEICSSAWAEVICAQHQRILQVKAIGKALCTPTEQPHLLGSVEENISKDHLSRVSRTLAERLDAALQLADLLFQVLNNLNKLHL